MNKDIIKESLIYEELELSPLWTSLSNRKDPVSNESPDNFNNFYTKRVELKKCIILLIALINDVSGDLELDLLKKISAYFDTLNNKLTQPQPIKNIKEASLMNEMISCDQLIFLEGGLAKKIDKKGLTIPFISSVSLKAMVENPEKKRKLWQDIKKLS